MKVTGKIIKILEKQTGTSQKGYWTKLSFVLDNNEQYNNIFCFEIFGQEKVEKFEKYNKVGDVVDVEFNVSTNEWQGKYFTTLQAWKVFKSDVSNIETVFETVSPEETKESEDDLPF